MSYDRAAELARTLAQMRNTKPYPLRNMFGTNPTPEQVAIHTQKMKTWNALYRFVSSSHRKAMKESREECQ